MTDTEQTYELALFDAVQALARAANKANEMGRTTDAQRLGVAHSQASTLLMAEQRRLMNGPAKVEIRWNPANQAETWWQAASKRSPSEVPRSCWPLFAAGPRGVTVSAEDAEAFKTWAAALPGWSDGPEHAKHPFTFHEAP